ncbi:hypothetical protein SISSUDRAFT_1043734 [Sistotremastrum suecicum HHB10207 ss-3]|uniref:F-box domain-containing protein n=1 Tax=Sistotremastrum suecicum HHB10207 ss-3 TaxID=1314776 RepID=A0A166FM15_9AGAM|nr:hypothetical protein SISSUDRAFT_1043734 [Sistotremastrum suecicum HHB10207 ss-3]
MDSQTLRRRRGLSRASISFKNVMSALPALNRMRKRAKLVSIPEDLILEIASYLSRKDQLHLGMSCSRLLPMILVPLYKNVSLTFARRNSSGHHTLWMLENTRALAQHVQTLSLRVHAGDAAATSKLAHVVCQSLRGALENMDLLRKFEWMSEEIPPEDDIWRVLRQSCPKINSLGVCFGLDLPRSDSQLYSFSNVKVFDLHLAPPFFERFLGEGRYAHSNMPPLAELWDMLINRCPDLETLSLNGRSFHPTACHRLCDGRWPNLQSLTLGDVIVNWDEANNNELPDFDGKERPFIRFLEHHPKLKYLNLIGSTQSTVSLDPLSSEALPVLEYFAGGIHHVSKLPNRTTLKGIRVTTPAFGSQVTVEYGLIPALKEMTALTALELHIVLHPELVCDPLFLSHLANACPNLESFDFVCGRASSVTFTAFGDILSHMTKLKRLNYRTLISGEENLQNGSVALVETIPSLQWLKLRLDKFEGVPEGWARTALVEEATFVISRGEANAVDSMRRIKFRTGFRGPRRNMAPIERTISGLGIGLNRLDLMALLFDFRDERASQARKSIAYMLVMTVVTFLLMDCLLGGSFRAGISWKLFSWLGGRL